MSERQYVLLDDRGVIRVSGADARSFLQGLVSNDMERVAAEHAVHTAFLTPQGKYLHDFFVAADGDDLLLDCEAARAGDLVKRLRIYKLRSLVDLADDSDAFAVAACIGDGSASALGLSGEAGSTVRFGGGIAYVDPRLADVGARLLLPRETAVATLEAAGFASGTRDDFDRRRIGLGLPDGVRDIEVEKAVLLEYGFDELNGVDWEKGCYMGQELTARTKYRGLIKKRLVPVAVDGPLPASGTPVVLGNDEVGEVRSGVGEVALALMRLEALENAAETNAPLTAGNARLTPVKPAWASY